MKRYCMIVSFLFFGMLPGFGAFQAVPNDPIQLTMVAEHEREVINAKGVREIKRGPAVKVLPGEVVNYAIHYANKGNERADDIVINNPVPEHMVYSEGSATGPGTVMLFSVDHGKTFRPPQELTVAGSDGKQRQARAEEYTNIRWVLQKPLAPGEHGTVSYKARLK